MYMNMKVKVSSLFLVSLLFAIYYLLFISDMIFFGFGLVLVLWSLCFVLYFSFLRNLSLYLVYCKSFIILVML